jgi:hypothetical protein
VHAAACMGEVASAAVHSTIVSSMCDKEAEGVMQPHVPCWQRHTLFITRTEFPKYESVASNGRKQTVHYLFRKTSFAR